ncbi:MAG: polysaccharide deacetylase family protein [Acidobacteria bacterium]|nr:polysaccharide deacetylase family protein [Acidobacteriota bacterium]
MMLPFVAAGAAAMAAAAWAVRGKSSRVFAPSVWHGPRMGEKAALTFDDGPSERTSELLDVLAAYKTKSTFFVCGKNAVRFPEIVRRIASEGHEIGNHTWSHPRLDFHSTDAMRAEIGRTQDVLSGITGTPPHLFRAPFGVRWPGLGTVQDEFGLLGVMWTHIGLDWKLPAGKVVARLRRGQRPGDIYCLHDGRKLEERPDISVTLAATREFLEKTCDRNFAFVTVSAMLNQ